jgi:FtsH-binding integral membrane protein
MSRPAPYEKKSEVSELRMLLRSPAIERDPQKRRDVLKRVVSLMTMGLDMSRLFSEITIAAHTDDPVVKKLVYQVSVRIIFFFFFLVFFCFFFFFFFSMPCPRLFVSRYS